MPCGVSHIEGAIESIATDVRTHGVIVNDPARPGTYKFAHKSFFEFLAAKAAAYQLLGIDKEFYGSIRAASGKPLDMTRSGEMLAFFGQIVVSNFERDRSVQSRSVERMLFDRMLGIDRAPSGLAWISRAWVLFVICSSFFGDDLFRRMFRTLDNSKVYVPEIRSGFGSVLLPMVIFGVLGVYTFFNVANHPTRPYSGIALPLFFVGMFFIMMWQLSSTHARRRLDRWGRCLQFGGRSYEDISRFLGTYISRHLAEDMERNRPFRLRKAHPNPPHAD